VLTITHATDPDVPALADLMEELDHFYGATEFDPRAERESQIRAALFGPAPVAYMLLAKDGPDLVGMASYSFLWPAVGLTSSLFLKELYVRKDRQRKGIGRHLMQELCRIATQASCSRVEWHTEDTNERSTQFYAALGAPILAGKLLYRLEGAALREFADQGDG
jgi:GNAT superfamily N-acetyltransferase